VTIIRYHLDWEGKPVRDKDGWLVDYDSIEDALQLVGELAEMDCRYGDDCPHFGSRHGPCIPCLARRALMGDD
jgi:hypothetical protein